MCDQYFDILQKPLSREIIMRALFENYESIYVVDVETSSFRCFHESESFNSLQIEPGGDRFFEAVKANIARIVHEDDQEYTQKMMEKEAILAGLEREKYYSLVYRLMIDGKPLYHKSRAIKETVGGRLYLFIGIRNIDAAFRQDKAHADEMAAMHKKERNHLEAIMASASGYWEANLSQNRMLEIAPQVFSDLRSHDFRLPTLKKSTRYSTVARWIAENLVAKNRKKYEEVSNRRYLMDCFAHGERRASVSFSFGTAKDNIRPCKLVFYLYQDDASSDILSFCVIYDLTEQQRKESELQELKHELQLSRIHNFTSQMQPHFLYNALGSIQEIILENPAYASELLGDFTIHLRSCIRAMANDAPLPFQQELANIKAYVNIEKMRFGDKLNVLYETDVQNFSILPLSVQPLVENAIRHGIYARGEQGGTVIVRTAEQEDAWCITVEDNGVGFDQEAFKNNLMAGTVDSTGLKNLMFRLEKVMHATVAIASTVGTGTTVMITIPKER